MAKGLGTKSLVLLLLVLGGWYALVRWSESNTVVSYEIRTAAPAEFLVTHNVLCKSRGSLESGFIYPSCGEERIFLSSNTAHTFRTTPTMDSVSKVKTEFLHPHYSYFDVSYDLASRFFPPRHFAEFQAFDPLPLESIMQIQRFALANNLEMNRRLPSLDWGTFHLFQIASKYLPRAYIEQRDLPEIRDVVARVAEHNRWTFEHYRRHPDRDPGNRLETIARMEIRNDAYEKIIYQILGLYDVTGPRPDWSRAQGPVHKFRYDEYERDRKALEDIFPYVPGWSSIDQLERISGPDG